MVEIASKNVSPAIAHDGYQVPVPADDATAVRAALRRWLAERRASMRMLAEFAAIDTAVVSNFLAGSVLDAGAAVRLLVVLFHVLSHAERSALVRLSRLSGVAEQLGSDTALDQRSPTDAQDWPQFRQLLQDALQTLRMSLRELARRSGLTAGALSRFMRAETMSLEVLSVLKLYIALRDGGQTAEAGRRLLSTAGMHAVAVVLRRMSGTTGAAANRIVVQADSTEHTFGRMHTDHVLGTPPLPAMSSARALYDQALQIYHTDWTGTLVLLDRAAAAAHDDANLRALALISMIMPLSSLGQFKRAAALVDRIERSELAAMSDTVRVEFFYHRSFLLMQHHDPSLGLRSLQATLQIAQDGAERSRLLESSVHHFGMLYHRLARLESSPIRRRMLLEQSLRSFEQEYAGAISTGHDLHIGYHFLRRSQVYRSLGDALLSVQLRRRAAALFRGSHSSAHIDLEEANLALRFGNVDYARAAQRFHTAYATWLPLGYQAGLSRALTGIGLAAIGDGNASAALTAHLAALLVHPEGAEHQRIEHRLTDAFDDLRRQRGWRWATGFLADLLVQARAADGLFRAVHWDERHTVISRDLLQQLGYPFDGVLSQSTTRD